MESHAINSLRKVDETTRILKDNRSERSSISSPPQRPALDLETTEHALDRIHTTASRAENLTSFDEYTASPRPSESSSKALVEELAQGGLSTLYSKLRSSVGGTRDSKSSISDESDHEKLANSRGRDRITQKNRSQKSGVTTAIASPTVPSTSSTRISSPSLVKDDERQYAIPSDVNVTDATLRNKVAAASIKSPIGRKAESAIEGADRSLFTSAVGLVDASFGTAPHSRSNSKAHSLRNDRTEDTPRFFPSDRNDTEVRATALTSTPVTTDKEGKVNEVNASDSIAALRIDLAIKEVTVPASGTITEAGSPQNVTDHIFKAAKREVLDAEALSSEDDSIHSKKENTIHSFEYDANIHSGLDDPSEIRPKSENQDLIAPSRLEGAMKSPITLMTAISPKDTLKRQNQIKSVSDSTKQLQRKLLGREYWMKDENAKDCFYCGDAFSTFRRKHHCRKCNHIAGTRGKFLEANFANLRSFQRYMWSNLRF